MGNIASIKNASVTDVGTFVANLDEALAPYSANFVNNRIDGYLLHNKDDQELHETLVDISIKTRLHRKRLISELRKLEDKEVCGRALGAHPTTGKFHPAIHIPTYFLAVNNPPLIPFCSFIVVSI